MTIFGRLFTVKKSKDNSLILKRFFINSEWLYNLLTNLKNINMKKIIILLLISVFYTLNSIAQDDQMKIWMEYMTPAKEHVDLAKMAGDWTFTSKMWMDPASPPQESAGTAKFEMILGGRYSLSKYSGKMMGMDFEGWNLLGFDNAKKVWVNLWMDNMGTGMMYGEGKTDDVSKKIIIKGEYFDPMTKTQEEYKETYYIPDENSFEFEMFMIKDGKELKNMELKFTKK